MNGTNPVCDTWTPSGLADCCDNCGHTQGEHPGLWPPRSAKPVTYPSAEEVRAAALRGAREDATLLARLAEDDGPPDTWKVKP